MKQNATIDEKLFAELWAAAQDGWEAFKVDAEKLPGYDEQFLRDAFIAGMITVLTIAGTDVWEDENDNR